MVFPIIRLPARYFDPVTQQPYYSIQAFKILREAYYMQLEEHGNRKNPEVVQWLEWRKKVKENRLKMLAKKLLQNTTTTLTETIATHKKTNNSNELEM